MKTIKYEEFIELVSQCNIGTEIQRTEKNKTLIGLCIEYEGRIFEINDTNVILQGIEKTYGVTRWLQSSLRHGVISYNNEKFKEKLLSYGKYDFVKIIAEVKYSSGLGHFGLNLISIEKIEPFYFNQRNKTSDSVGCTSLLIFFLLAGLIEISFRMCFLNI